MTDTDVRRIEDKVDAVAITLARLEGALTPTLEKLTDAQADTDRRLTEIDERTTSRLGDFERRMRSMERFRYSIPSLAVLSLLMSAAMLVYYVTK